MRAGEGPCARLMVNSQHNSDSAVLISNPVRVDRGVSERPDIEAASSSKKYSCRSLLSLHLIQPTATTPPLRPSQISSLAILPSVSSFFRHRRLHIRMVSNSMNDRIRVRSALSRQEASGVLLFTGRCPLAWPNRLHRQLGRVVKATDLNSEQF